MANATFVEARLSYYSESQNLIVTLRIRDIGRRLTKDIKKAAACVREYNETNAACAGAPWWRKPKLYYKLSQLKYWYDGYIGAIKNELIHAFAPPGAGFMPGRLEVLHADHGFCPVKLDSDARAIEQTIYGAEAFELRVFREDVPATLEAEVAINVGRPLLT